MVPHETDGASMLNNKTCTNTFKQRYKQTQVYKAYQSFLSANSLIELVGWVAWVGLECSTASPRDGSIILQNDDCSSAATTRRHPS